MPDLSLCPECGAPEGACKEKFESMLALEFEDPTVFGIVHHITVICFNLQHPASFSEEARSWMCSTLHAAIVEGLSPLELRERSRKQFNGKVKVLSKTPHTFQRVKWSMNIMAVRTDSPDVYVNDVKAWAQSILDDIGTR